MWSVSIAYNMSCTELVHCLYIACCVGVFVMKVITATLDLQHANYMTWVLSS